MARKPTEIVSMSLRIREGLRRRLEQEAKRQDRSLNAEIISRLDQSFLKAEEANLVADALRAVLGDRTGDLLRAVTTAIFLIERETGKKWYRDESTFTQVKLATEEIMRAVAHPLTADRAFERFKEELPPDILEKHPDLAEMIVREFGHQRAWRAAALEALQKMGMAPPEAEIEEFAKTRAKETLNAEKAGGEQ